MRVLQLIPLTVAILHFGSAWTKVILGSPGIAWEWMSAGNLGRWATSAQIYWDPPTQLGEFMLHHPVLLSLAAVGTIVLEAGLLVAVVVGLPITPIVLESLGMHTVIALALSPFFLDQYIFLSLLLPWDTVYNRLGPTTRQLTSYTTNTATSVRSLYPFKILDVTNAV